MGTKGEFDQLRQQLADAQQQNVAKDEMIRRLRILANRPPRLFLDNRLVSNRGIVGESGCAIVHGPSFTYRFTDSQRAVVQLLWPGLDNNLRLPEHDIRYRLQRPRSWRVLKLFVQHRRGRRVAHPALGKFLHHADGIFWVTAG